jgi:hypothetical protein
MMHTLELARRVTRLRAVAVVSGLLALLSGACNSADNLAPAPTVATNFDSIATDSLPPDSLAGDSLASDSLPADSVAAFDAAISAATISRTGIPFGPFDLYKSWDRPATSGFIGAINYASPSGIIKLLNNMRAHGTRGFLKMTGDHMSRYQTRGRFDYRKWQKATARYYTPAIRKAIALAVANGTLLGYSMIDEPNRFNWGVGSINKAMLDRMARYSKSLFPTLPTAAVVTYYWRPNERYRVLDVIISQTWAPTKSAATFRSEAIAAARQNGVKLAFALNILSGPKVAGCKKYGKTCIMTPRQIRQWALTLGPATCGMFMWKYNPSLFARSDYKAAFKTVAATLARQPQSGCRRS